MKMPRGILFATCLVAGLLGQRSMAWPVDWIHDVAVGREKFVKLSQVDWFEVEDPSIAELEWQKESGELLVMGKKAGRTLVLLGAEGRIAAWRVRVEASTTRDAKSMAAVISECDVAKVSTDADLDLKVFIKTRSCYDVLKQLLQSDEYEARRVELVFDATILQHQLRVLDAALKRIAGSKAEARYVGAGLVLEGDVSPDEYRKIMWAVLRNTLGRFALDDRLVVTVNKSTNR